MSMNNSPKKSIFQPNSDPQEPQKAIACFLYNYNEELAYKPILLHRRVLEWYKGDGINCHAIQNQQYLEPGNLRNDTLEAVMRRGRLSQIEAIKQIIFQHTVPFSLIKAILTYGSILHNDDSITIEAHVQINCDTTEHHYFIAEVTGKICADHIKIWHTFLRASNPDDTTTQILQETSSLSHLPSEILEIPTDMPLQNLMQQITKEEQTIHHAGDCLEGFSSPIEIEKWEINDTTACVTVKQGSSLFTVFKQ